MRKPLMLLYVIGMSLLAVAFYLYSYHTTLALWENPELAESTLDPTNWSVEMREKHKILIYPYQKDGLLIAFIAVSSFLIVPTLTVKAVQADNS